MTSKQNNRREEISIATKLRERERERESDIKMKIIHLFNFVLFPQGQKREIKNK